MNDNDFPITLEDPETEIFDAFICDRVDAFLWWIFVTLSIVGSMTMLVGLLAGAGYLVRRWT